MNIQLETIQYTKSQSSFNFFKREVASFHSYRHYHPELELTFIERGNGIRYIGDNISSFESGDLVLIGENLPHDYVSFPSKNQESSIAYVFQFPVSMINSIAEAKILRELFGNASQGIHFPNPDQSLLDRIKSISPKSSLSNFIQLLAILNTLYQDKEQDILSSIAFSKRAANLESQNKISRVTKYIAEEYHQAIPLSYIAQFCNMTRPSFCRWFKQATGVSFVTYLNTTRVEKACQLLLQTEDPIAAIGFQTGFETIGHFNRTFKKIKKMTPKAYRKTLVNY